MKRRRTRRARGPASAGAISCFEARPILSALLDGEADDLQQVRVERHLRSCARCRDFHHFSGRTGALVRGSSAAALEDASEEHAHTAAWLATAVRASGEGRRRSNSWRSVVVGATLTAALSLGAVIGGLGVWTLTQEAGGPEASSAASPSLPRVAALRTLDPGTTIEEPLSILTAWAPPRPVENTLDEKAMFWVTPMSHFERVHFRPEQL